MKGAAVFSGEPVGVTTIHDQKWRQSGQPPSRYLLGLRRKPVGEFASVHDRNHARSKDCPAPSASPFTLLTGQLRSHLT